MGKDDKKDDKHSQGLKSGEWQSDRGGNVWFED